MTETGRSEQSADAPASPGTAPEPDLESAPWWEGLRRHKILLQRCRTCDRPRFPPMPGCPWCASESSEVVESPGQGVVYSFVTAHAAVSPGYTGPLPYTVATVELAEGPRLLGRVEPPAPVAIGDRVTARFVDHAAWTELCFARAAPS
jgi:uncharacterized OB-fold protein